MNEDRRKQWNADRLAELYPPFRDKISAIVIELESHGFRPRIHEAWRSEADQLKAVKSGNSHLTFGFHNVRGADGTREALAVDMVDDDVINKQASHENSEFLLRLEAATRRQGLMTGIDFALEKLPDEMKKIDDAIANEEWKAPIPSFGWDPGHVQPKDITPEEARIGKRPL